MCDIFNVSASAEDIMKISDNIFELLKIKYHLVIVDDSPMKVEKSQHREISLASWLFRIVSDSINLGHFLFLLIFYNL